MRICRKRTSQSRLYRTLERCRTGVYKNNKNNKQDKEKNKNENNKDQQKQKQQDEKMSKDNAEQLLNAAMQQEKATQQKLKKAQNQPRNSNHLKNW